MNIQILTAEISNENRELANEEVKNFIGSFDPDFSGENGIEYASTDAVENGFSNDLDYYLHEYSNLKIYAMLNRIMGDLLATYSGQGIKADYKIDLRKDGLKFNLVFAYLDE